MLILNGQQGGTSLGIPLHYMLVLPKEALLGNSYPLILCLHDLGQSSEVLLHQLSLALLSDEAHAAILIPDGRRSCFVDMAHGPCWATALGNDVLSRLQAIFHIRTECAGVIGIGTGALGAIQIAKKTERTRFVCAMVDPAMETPFIWDDKLWPSRQEWLGVFDGKQEEWLALFRMENDEQSKFHGEKTISEKLTQAFSFCSEQMMSEWGSECDENDDH